jgi:hypothetical protein
MCVISFGLADGLNEAIKTNIQGTDDWHQAAAGFQDGTLMIAILRATLLLDSDDTKVSFQTIYRRLKSPSTQIALKCRLSDK